MSRGARSPRAALYWASMRPLLPRLAVLLALALATPALAQQVPDTTFDTRVERPAFTGRHPVVRIDEAHHEFHTMSGRYRVFAELAAHDGCRVEPGTVPLSAATLAGCDVLVIANALGDPDMGAPKAAEPAFTDAECEAVRDWVRAGGALLLIADHAPMGASARGLAARLGVDMRSAYTVDPEYGDPRSPSNITYETGRGLDSTHAIVRGRDSSERVRKVTAFTGQSLAGPPGATSLLTLSPRATDLMVGLGQASADVPDSLKQSAAGRSQALAFTLGRGRVVVFGEAAMLTAQLAGPGHFKMGMNWPGLDNRQLALNVVRWLAGALP